MNRVEGERDRQPQSEREFGGETVINVNYTACLLSPYMHSITRQLHEITPGGPLKTDQGMPSGRQASRDVS